jgi:CitMHS family citrate-Mg2+:H+ or citrate-Ca2+:H+ symporter
LLTITGTTIIVVVVALLLTGKCAPLISLALVPLAGALMAGFTPPEIAGFYTNGLAKVAPVATMFIFAIVFFGLMQDVGLFRPLIRGLLSLTRGNVVAVAVCTALMGMIAHLDGAGATTFLLTIPALLPLYKRLRMSPYLMLMLLAIGAGMMNMIPWAGPLGRASAVTGVDTGELWRPLIPLQAIGAVILMVLAVILGLRERRRIAVADAVAAESLAVEPRAVGAASAMALSATIEDTGPSGLSAQQGGVAGIAALEDSGLPTNTGRARLLLNTGIFVAVLASLVSGILPAPLVFMIGTALALVMNFSTQAEPLERVKAHAPNALLMAAIILTAGAFLGIMDRSGMLRAIAQDVAHLLPAAAVPYLHLILGVLGLPMELLLSTDAYYFGLLPIVQEIVGAHGVSPMTTVHTMVVGNIVGTFISPFSPALWLALGLAALDMGKHIRYSLLWMWAYSLILMAVSVAMGLIPLAITA